MSKAAWTKWEDYQCDRRMGKQERIAPSSPLKHPYAEWTCNNKKLYPERQFPSGNTVNRFKKSPQFIRYFENER